MDTRRNAPQGRRNKFPEYGLTASPKSLVHVVFATKQRRSVLPSGSLGMISGAPPGLFRLLHPVPRLKPRAKFRGPCRGREACVCARVNATQGNGPHRQPSGRAGGLAGTGSAEAVSAAAIASSLPQLKQICWEEQTGISYPNPSRLGPIAGRPPQATPENVLRLRPWRSLSKRPSADVAACSRVEDFYPSNRL